MNLALCSASKNRYVCFELRPAGQVDQRPGKSEWWRQGGCRRHSAHALQGKAYLTGRHSSQKIFDLMRMRIQQLFAHGGGLSTRFLAGCHEKRQRVQPPANQPLSPCQP